MDAARNYYVTTPIYYVNDKPHIGHAYTTIACDVIARFKRLDGYHVHFLTGTDEHGQKVEKAAGLKGVDPQSFTDEVSMNFRKMADALNCCYDDFIRTTETRHIKSVQALWTRLLESGNIYLGAYEGWYAVRDEAFYTESELTRNADGNLIAPSGAEVEWVEEPSYFFRLSAWGERLLEFYAQNPDFIMPKNRRNEIIRFVKDGLRDLSISRTTFKWGVRVPGDDDHIMYVWLDALTNYMTAVGYPDEKSDLFKTFWPADLHMVGKDIARFHAIYWPAFLLAAGLPVPKRVFAHGWWTNDGKKISKSLGNAIDPIELISTYGLDQTRFFLMREVPFGNDGDFSRKAMIQRINSELANDFGNLCQRVLSMIFKNCEKRIPQPDAFTDEDNQLLSRSASIVGRLRLYLDKQAFHKGLEIIWQVIGEANRYIDAQAPWGLKKTDPERMATVLYVLGEVVRRLAILTQPYMPDASGRILDQLKQDPAARTFADLDKALVAGAELDKPQGVFPRFIEEEDSD